jgi:hypothetical protein
MNLYSNRSNTRSNRVDCFHYNSSKLQKQYFSNTAEFLLLQFNYFTAATLKTIFLKSCNFHNMSHNSSNYGCFNTVYVSQVRFNDLLIINYFFCFENYYLGCMMTLVMWTQNFKKILKRNFIEIKSGTIANS